MAMTQDELGNWYDDGNDSGNFNNFPGSAGTQSVVGSSSPSVDEDFAPTYPITGGGIGGRSVVGNTGGITNYLKSLDLTTAGGLAGAALGATGAFTNKPKKAYEGTIPQLQAVRNMVTAPPPASTGYRPGQGGVNWNSDVAYVPRGSVPVGTGTDMATQAAAANAARAAAAAKAAAPKSNSGLSTLAKVAGTAGIASLLSNVLGKNTNLTGLVDKAGNLTTAGINTLTNALKAATAGGGLPGGVTPKGGGSPAGGGGGKGGTSGVGETPEEGANEALTTPEGEYAGGDEFSGIDEQVAANENALETPNVLTDEEIQAELERVNAETDAEFGTGEDAVINNDAEQGLSRSMGGGNAAGTTDDYFNYGGGDDYSFDLGDLGLGGEDYSSYFDYGGGDDFSFDLGDYARGGKVNMAKGRYLQGNTDGMADKIPARIGKKQPAALSHGEFVVPADVVSHLGNGNSDAGAKKLYEMMDRIRVARTGNKEQGKQINPDKFMPGGLAQAYANGGKVQGFAGPEGSAVGATGLGSAVNAGITGTETGPNSWAGDYMSDLLGKTQALTESPYQQYMGPLTAGASTLQNKAFTGLENTAFPTNLGQSFSSQGAYAAPTLGANGTTPSTPATPGQPQGIASQYMNPYLQSVLDPQMAELRRQSQLNLQPGLAKLTQAGGFGGSRQAIMESEANRNLLQEQNKTVGQGYANAYDKAMNQFNTEQTQGRSLADLFANQGATQRNIEAEGIAADKKSFEEARKNPYEMLTFQQSMLQGMPVSATSYNIAQPTTAQEIMAGAAGGAKAVGKSNKTVADLLQQLGL